MKDQSGKKEKDRQHWMRCPGCGEEFDMRDLAMVMAHEHWLPETPAVSFSHARKEGREEEVYIKRAGRMVTLRLARLAGNASPASLANRKESK